MLDTQELAPVAIALLLSVIGGIGTFLMDVRDGRQSGNLLGLVTEIFVAVTAARWRTYWGNTRAGSYQLRT